MCSASTNSGRDTSHATSSSQARERRTGLSCAECRRSKLKCDRAIPCQACVRRGCAAICPEGTLTATKGNKVLQARAQKLGEQVQSMTARIKELEAALSEAQSTVQSASRAPPPQVPEEPNREPDAEVHRLIEAVGSLAINDDGASKYHGSTSSSEYLTSLLPSDGTEKLAQRDPKFLGLPSEILNLLYAFPLGMPNCPHDTSIFACFIPSRETALELADAYWLCAAWQFTPILRSDFYENIFDSIYVSGEIVLDRIRPHELSLFFAILAAGLLWNNEPSAAYVRDQYDALARAAFSLAPIAKSVTCTTSQVLFCMVRFLNNVYRTCAEECWLLHGINVRISQMIALQYDGLAFKLEEKELQRRRLMFWELYTWDVWNGFVMGRVPSLRLEFTDCKFPANDSGHEQVSGEWGFHAWKFRYTAAILPATLRHAFSPGNMPYTSLIELDRKIRTFPMPSHLQLDLQSTNQRSWSMDLPTALQQLGCIFMKETNLLYLHRSYFAIAIHDDPVNPLSHSYGASVVATFRSACRMCLAAKGLYLLHPKALSQVWYYWSQLFSACVALAALVLGAPHCSLAQEALIELNSAVAFYEEGSTLCRPSKTMQILSKLKQRARDLYAQCRSQPSDPDHSKTALRSSDPETADEFGILNGRIGVIRHKSESPAHSPCADQALRKSQSPPTTSLNNLPLFPVQLHHSQIAQPQVPTIHPGNNPASFTNQMPTSFPTHDGSFMESGPSSTTYQDTLSRFLSFGPLESVPHPGYAQGLDPSYEFDMMSGQVPYNTGNGSAFQPTHDTNEGIVRRDTWSSFIDRLMADPTPHV
ncbi:unnamed protein product [Somion occarium]|uniref:Zn(2)-C6 fungal-type domain-containing protein n=1 Tax=Somion occarium TaxID=3059160 RepID=A0ABP1E664_9APHY